MGPKWPQSLHYFYRFALLRLHSLSSFAGVNNLAMCIYWMNLHLHLCWTHSRRVVIDWVSIDCSHLMLARRKPGAHQYGQDQLLSQRIRNTSPCGLRQIDNRAMTNSPLCQHDLRILEIRRWNRLTWIYPEHRNISWAMGYLRCSW